MAKSKVQSREKKLSKEGILLQAAKDLAKSADHQTFVSNVDLASWLANPGECSPDCLALATTPAVSATARAPSMTSTARWDSAGRLVVLRSVE